MTKISSLKAMAEAALAKLESGKTYMLSDVHARVRQASETNPGDTVIQAFAHVIERMAQGNPESIVSQNDMDKVYQELVGLNANTNFREVLGDLIVSRVAEPNVTNADFANTLRNSDNEPVSCEIETDLELGGLFADSANKYNPQLVQEAQNKVTLELRSLGFDCRKISLAKGNSQYLVFVAELDTNRGKMPVYIPAVASGDQLPSTFIAGNKLEHLTHANLKEHIKTASARDIRMPSIDLDTLAIPSVSVPEPLKALAQDAEESIMEATTSFPAASVRLAKRMLIGELGSMGFKNSQVRVAESTADGFICEATLNAPKGQLNIEIPVEMNNQTPLLPSVFAQGDYVADFTAENLHEIANREADLSTTAVFRSSPLMGLDIGQLKEVIVKSAIKGDLDTCDEVLEVVAERFEPTVYSATVADYQAILRDIKTTKATMEQAYNDRDQFVMSPNHMQPVHKKLGRPASELVRDENGEYHLKATYYARKNQKEEGAIFSTAKILVGD